MSLVALANHLAEKGRGDDKMLVHMTPGEVQGLQALALASGGSLTINPETGLVEAGWLKKMLPAIAGFALNFIAPGVGSAIGAALGGLSGAAGTAIAVGGITGLATGSLKQGLMAGLGAFGGASLASGLAGAAGAQGTAGALGVEGAATGVGSQAQMLATQNAGFGTEGLQRLAESAATAPGATPSLTPALTSGIQNLGNEAGRKAFMDTVGGTAGLRNAALMAGAPAIAAAMEPPEAMKMRPMDPGNISRFSFDPFSQTYTRLGSQPAGMASGGIVALAAGGASDPNKYAAEIAQGKQAIPYAQGTAASQQDISNIYQSLLGRAPDEGGLAFYQSSQFSPEQIRQNIMQSPEYQAFQAGPKTQTQLGAQAVPYAQGTAATQDEIKNIYKQLLRREADVGGLEFYGASKFSPDQIRQEIMKSEEFKGLPAFIDEPAPVAFQPTAPTAQEVRTTYEQGGGSTTMPSVNVLGAGERPMTQNAVVDKLQAYLAANPTATGEQIRAWGTANGVPAAQLNAAINERRFSMLTGGSKSAYDYLMGRGEYPTVPFTPTGEIMRPYGESVLGIPVDKTKRKLIFDPTTRRYIPNPDYVAPPATGATTTIGSGTRVPRDPMGNPYTGLAASYFAANPDVKSAFETQVGGMTPEEYVRFHWNTFGRAEGRQGFIESQTAQPANPATPGGGATGGDSNADILPFNKGGIAMLAGAADGGQFNLGGYSDGGRLLRGPGDGVSDSIPAVIGKKQPARLADGEFVIPARIVSEIGNGSTEAGARKLYAMMDRVQRARAKTTGKGKVAKNTRADEYLPA